MLPPHKGKVFEEHCQGHEMATSICATSIANRDPNYSTVRGWCWEGMKLGNTTTTDHAYVLDHTVMKWQQALCPPKHVCVLLPVLNLECFSRRAIRVRWSKEGIC